MKTTRARTAAKFRLFHKESIFVSSGLLNAQDLHDVYIVACVLHRSLLVARPWVWVLSAIASPWFRQCRKMRHFVVTNSVVLSAMPPAQCRGGRLDGHGLGRWSRHDEWSSRDGGGPVGGRRDDGCRGVYRIKAHKLPCTGPWKLPQRSWQNETTIGDKNKLLLLLNFATIACHFVSPMCPLLLTNNERWLLPTP